MPCQICAISDGPLAVGGSGTGSDGWRGAAWVLFGLAAFGSGAAVVGAAVGFVAFGVVACGVALVATLGASIFGTRWASFGASALAACRVGSLMPVAVPRPSVTFVTVPPSVV